MRIASITMVGQFPHWINLHVNNLKWALKPEDHIYVITTDDIIAEYNLINDNKVSYISFKKESKNTFINFWKDFSKIINKNNINAEWFLFMEQDILFFAKPVLPENKKTINSFLPIGDYHNIIKDKKIIHSRVWEGAQIFHKDIISNAIKNNINFSFVKKSFPINELSLSMYSNPDTMDEFGLYCAEKEKTNVKHDVKSCHLRGPESIHRKYPEIYNFCENEVLSKIQKEMPYVDILISVFCYYICGVWNDIRNIDWNNLKKESKENIKKLSLSCKEWMTKDQYSRFLYIYSKINY